MAKVRPFNLFLRFLDLLIIKKNHWIDCILVKIYKKCKNFLSKRFKNDQN